MPTGTAIDCSQSTERLCANRDVDGGRTRREIAKHLDDRRVPTARGGYWHAQTVMRPLDRLGLR
jgi:hypothetical protein